MNISNDGWFGESGAPWQHLDVARMRAIENNRWLLRGTNTGITAVIDPYGRIVQVAPRNQRTAYKCRMRTRRKPPSTHVTAIGSRSSVR